MVWRPNASIPALAKNFYGTAEERDEIGVATAVYYLPTGGDVIAAK